MVKLEKLLTIFLFVFGIITQTYSADCTNKADWDASTVYEVAGMEVVYEGKLYTSQHWTQGQIPADNFGEGKPWSLIGICDAVVPNYESPTMTPSNGSTMNSGTTTFSWTEVAGATGYQIMVGSVANGNDYFPGSSNANNGGDGNLTNSYLIGSLPTDESTFYVTLTVWHPDGVIKENYTYISYLQNSAPEVVSFSPIVSFEENVETAFGSFVVNDVDNDNVTLELVSGAGNNDRFTLDGFSLMPPAGGFDYEVETNKTFTVVVRATDEHGIPSTDYTRNFTLQDVDPEYNYPQSTGKDEDMIVEGRTKYTNVADGLTDSTIIDGGTLTAKKIIVDELQYSDQGGVEGSFTVPGALSVGGSVSIGGAMDVDGKVDFNDQVDLDSLHMEKSSEGNPTYTLDAMADSIKMKMDVIGQSRNTIIQPGRFELSKSGDGTSVVEGAQITTSNSMTGATNISGGTITARNIRPDSLSMGENSVYFAKSYDGNATLDARLDADSLKLKAESPGGSHSTAIAPGVIKVQGIGTTVGETVINGSHITASSITVSDLNVSGDQVAEGNMTVNGGLDVIGNIVAGDVISLAENTEGNETNNPTYGLDPKFLHMGLVEGWDDYDENGDGLGWGLHLNAMSFSGNWGHNPIFYHGGEHIFFSREGLANGDPETELMRINSSGDLNVKGDISTNNGSLTAGKIITSSISSELNITAGHGNWLNLNNMNGKKWMIHNPSGQDKLEIGRNDGTVDKFGYLAILENGNVGIGTTTPETRLHVEGDIKANTIAVSQVKIDDWVLETPDYVFQSDYKLRSLEDVEKHIKEKSHLPEVPSAADMKRDGVDLAEMNMILLKKTEELTLYIIEQNKKIEELTEKVESITK